MKSFNKAKALFVMAAVAALACALALAGCGSSDSSKKITVTVDMDATALVDAGVAVDADFFNGTVEIDEGSSVYDALVATGVDFDCEGDYVTSLCGVDEGQVGSWSGWLYTVNDLDPMADIVDFCRDYILNDGDTVHWIYAVTM